MLKVRPSSREFSQIIRKYTATATDLVVGKPSQWQQEKNIYQWGENHFRQQDNAEINLQFKLFSIGSINVTYHSSILNKKRAIFFVAFEEVVNFVVYLKNIHRF